MLRLSRTRNRAKEAGISPEKLLESRFKVRRLGKEARAEGRGPTRQFMERSRNSRDVQRERDSPGKVELMKFVERETLESEGRRQREELNGPWRSRELRLTAETAPPSVQDMPVQLHGVDEA